MTPTRYSLASWTACVALFALSGPIHAQPPLSEQLVALGKQAEKQGYPEQATDFYRKAMELEPGNPTAKLALAQMKPAAADGASNNATIENAAELERVRGQQTSADISSRLQEARRALATGNTASAKDILRLALTVIQADDSLSESAKTSFRNQIQTQYQHVVRQEDRLDLERADVLRREANETQRARAIDSLVARQSTVNSIIQQFDNLMLEGRFRVLSLGGTGNIALTTLPFIEARETARQARGLLPNALAPRAGMFVASTTGYLTQTLAYEELKENRYMASLQDVERASVPFPDTITIEHPPVTTELLRRWEERAERYGRPVSLVTRDDATKKILQKLEEPITIQYPSDTPLDEVLKYIKSATSEANYAGIQYYLDPIGLQEADRTETSVVKIDLENIPLKTALKLILDQIGLTYTVKDGILKIDNRDSENLDTEIRVYPVADLALIPVSLMGGGGGGGFGGGGGGLGGGGLGGGGLGGGGFGGGGLGGGGLGGGGQGGPF